MALPIPRVPPVTSASFPCRFSMTSRVAAAKRLCQGAATRLHPPSRGTLGKIRKAMPAGPRQLLQDRFAVLSSDLESLFAEAGEQTRRDLAEQLNKSVRCLRMAGNPEELCATVAKAAGCFAGGALLFRIEDGMARSSRIEVALSAAPALAAAAAGNDPVVALATPSEVSAELAELLGHNSS